MGQDRPRPKFGLAKGERQRERIVTQAEFFAYRELAANPGVMWQRFSMVQGCGPVKRIDSAGSTFS
jgi:hypothetical protein